MGAATLGAVLAKGWFAQRAGLITVDPLEPLGTLLVDQPVALAVGLGVVAVTVAGTARARTARAASQSKRAFSWPLHRGRAADRTF